MEGDIYWYCVHRWYGLREFKTGHSIYLLSMAHYQMGEVQLSTTYVNIFEKLFLFYPSYVFDEDGSIIDNRRDANQHSVQPTV